MTKKMTDSDYLDGQSIEPEQVIHPLVTLPDDENLPALGQAGLHRYLQEISQHELLSREETEELAIRYQETHDPDQERLDHRRQALDRRGHLLVVENFDLLQQLLQGARFLADRELRS